MIYLLKAAWSESVDKGEWIYQSIFQISSIHEFWIIQGFIINLIFKSDQYFMLDRVNIYIYIHSKDFQSKITIRSRTNRILASVWYKRGTFQMVMVSIKGLPLPWDLKASIPLLRAFKWGIVCRFTSKGVKTTRS